MSYFDEASSSNDKILPIWLNFSQILPIVFQTHKQTITHLSVQYKVWVHKITSQTDSGSYH